MKYNKVYNDKMFQALDDFCRRAARFTSELIAINRDEKTVTVKAPYGE